MLEKIFYVITFETTHYAIAAEKLFKEKKYPIQIIPTPREITSSCGLSIRFDESFLPFVKKDITESNIAIKGVYILEKKGKDRIVTIIN